MKLTFTEKLLYIIATIADHNRRFFSWQLALSAMDGDPRLYKHRRWLIRKLENKREKQKLYRALHEFKKRKFIEEKIFNNKRGYILSPKGSMKVFRLEIKDSKKKKLPRGQYLMVFFDIPEKRRPIRNSFRFAIRELGFEKIQRSVWACPYDVSKELKDLVKDCKLVEFVKILIVKGLDSK